MRIVDVTVEVKVGKYIFEMEFFPDDWWKISASTFAVVLAFVLFT